MSGYLKEEHLAVQKSARRFTEEKIIPIADQLDREEAEVPQEIIDQMGEMGELGFYGILIPENSAAVYVLCGGEAGWRGAV
jgi:alkylation response protein AidB-like acyl-CoA dehydrogenase